LKKTRQEARREETKGERILYYAYVTQRPLRLNYESITCLSAFVLPLLGASLSGKWLVPLTSNSCGCINFPIFKHTLNPVNEYRSSKMMDLVLVPNKFYEKTGLEMGFAVTCSSTCKVFIHTYMHAYIRRSQCMHHS
jgi:hypothetical protein